MATTWKRGSLSLDKALKIVLAVIAIALIAVFAVLAIRRSYYPYELEWMEGAMVDHVTRLLDGEQIYVAPSVYFIAFSYAPLYFYLGAAFSWIFGEGFFSLRLISISVRSS